SSYNFPSPLPEPVGRKLDRVYDFAALLGVFRLERYRLLDVWFHYNLIDGSKDRPGNGARNEGDGNKSGSFHKRSEKVSGTEILRHASCRGRIHAPSLFPARLRCRLPAR